MNALLPVPGPELNLYRYTSKAALDAHMASQPVAEVHSFFGDNPPQMTVTLSETSSAFVRPEVTQASDPFICHASITYKPGKRDEALEGWKTVTSETQKNEPETLGYAIVKDQQNENVIQSFEVYSSQQYFKEVHVPSKAVQENVKQYGNEIRVSLTHALLKLEAGYLYKP
jgi:quinol monooxygenase YgiN